MSNLLYRSSTKMCVPVTLIIGNSNPSLFEKVATHAADLLHAAGITDISIIRPRKSSDASLPNTVVLEKFSNGEIHVDIGENVRGHTVYIMQTEDNVPGYSANDYLMELILLISACKLASAKTINVMIPSYFYARQDKKDRSRVPISAKMIARMLEDAGASCIICVDLHAAQIQGFFDIPVNNLYAIRYLRQHFEKLIEASGRSRSDFVLIAPDLGCEKRISAYSSAMGLRYAIAAKTRNHTKASVVEKLTLYGAEDCEGKIGIIIDDMTDTGGTLVALVSKLEEYKFSEFWVGVTHGILSGKAVACLGASAAITRIICTNTIDRTAMTTILPKLEIVDISELLARTIYTIETGGSISALFDKTEPPTPILKVIRERLSPTSGDSLPKLIV